MPAILRKSFTAWGAVAGAAADAEEEQPPAALLSATSASAIASICAGSSLAHDGEGLFQMLCCVAHQSAACAR